MPNDQFDVVCLDAGGVLVFPNWIRVSQSLARHGVLVPPEALANAEPAAKYALDRGAIVGATTDAGRGWHYFDNILRIAGVTVSHATDAALDELKAYHDDQNLWELVPADVPLALARLHASGRRLVVVSNANGRLRFCLERLGLAHWFHAVIDSHEVGVEKPDPRLFEIALACAGGTPDRAVHVGDLYHVDVVGARAAGLRAVLLDAADLYRDVDCPRVFTLDGLVDMLNRGDLTDGTK